MYKEVPNFWYSSKKCPLHERIYLRIFWKYQLPMQLSKIKEFSLSLCNNTENHDYKDHTESLLNMLYKIVIVCNPPPPFCWGKRGGFNLLPNFRKGEDLTGPQFLEGGCLERGVDFFQGRGGGGGWNFSKKKKKKNKKLN